MPETLVVALGGNAITRPGEPGTIPQQFEHTAETLEHLQAAVPQRLRAWSSRTATARRSATS